MLSRIQAAAAQLALILMSVLAGGQAVAAGALAIDTLQGEKYGFSFNHPSSDQADKRAMRECGADCSVVMRFRAECAAYAVDQAKGSNAYGWGTGATSSAVQQRAMSECRAKGGLSCKVRSWGCDAIKISTEREAGSKESKPANPEFQIQGSWHVEYLGSDGLDYSGTLQVNEKTGTGIYAGLMVLSFTNIRGRPEKVQQDARITVRENTVIVQGSNPIYLLGSGSYDADTLTLRITGPDVLEGKGDDVDGPGGPVIITRN